MKNSDMPESPVFDNKGIPGMARITDFILAPVQGLTKREHFAGLAMQGFASDPELTITQEQVASLSVAWADALLAELDK